MARDARPPVPIRSKVYEHFCEKTEEFVCKIVVDVDSGKTCKSAIKKRKTASAGGAACNLKRHLSRFHTKEYDLLQKAEEAPPAKVPRVTTSRPKPASQISITSQPSLFA